MEVNEHIIRLSGRATLPSPLDMAKTYNVTLSGEVVSITESNNQNGTCDKIYTFKPVLVEVVNERGEAIKSKDTRSMSKKLRACLYKEWKDSGSELSDEDYYSQRMSEIIGKVIEGGY